MRAGEEAPIANSGESCPATSMGTGYCPGLHSDPEESAAPGTFALAEPTRADVAKWQAKG